MDGNQVKVCINVLGDLQILRGEVENASAEIWLDANLATAAIRNITKGAGREQKQSNQ